MKEENEKWNNETFGNIITNKRNLELKMEILQLKIINEGIIEQRKQEELNLQNKVGGKGITRREILA